MFSNVNYRFFSFLFIIILFGTTWNGQAQVLQFRTKKVGYCKLINGQKTSNMTWVSAPNGSVIVDFDGGKIFINGTHYALFKITHVYDPQYSTAFVLYKYDTKDSIGNKVTFALTMLKNHEKDWEIAFVQGEFYLVFQMNIYDPNKNQ